MMVREIPAPEIRMTILIRNAWSCNKETEPAVLKELREKKKGKQHQAPPPKPFHLIAYLLIKNIYK